MGITRRQLLTQAGSGLAANSLIGQSLFALGENEGIPTSQSSWEQIRKLFPLDSTYIHLAGLLLASHPTPVAEAISQHRKALDRNPVDAYHAQSDAGEKATRNRAATYLGVEPSEIALTDSATMGLALLYNGIRLGDGQEILTTTHDHPSTYESIKNRAARTGISFRKVSLYEDGAFATETEMVDRLVKGIRANTRVLALTWVHSCTGVKLPLKSISEVVAKLNRERDEKDRVLLCVDGAHGLGVEPNSLPELGCDFFAAGCHKWIFGPRGTGIFWARTSVAEEVQPIFPSFSGKETWGQRLTPGGFHSFEHRWALPRAFELHLAIGKQKVADRIHALNRQLKEGLSKIKGLKLYTPQSDSLSAGIVCFEMNGIPNKELVARLAAKRIIASTTPYEISYARLTPGLLNTPAQIEKTLEVLKGFGRIS